MFAEPLPVETVLALVIVVAHKTNVTIPWNWFLLTGVAGYTLFKFAVRNA